MPEEKTRRYSFFSHRECEYFPCHKGADPEKFNCLFCYCPLYVLGRECGGNFTYTEHGIKSCVNCLYPHNPEHYDRILSRYREIIEKMNWFLMPQVFLLRHEDLYLRRKIQSPALKAWICNWKEIEKKHVFRRIHASCPCQGVQLRGLEPLPKYMDMNLNHARMPIPPQLHIHLT